MDKMTNKSVKKKELKKGKKDGSHMMPNGKMMKDSAMKMAKKKAGK